MTNNQEIEKLKEEWLYKSAHLDIGDPNDVHEISDWWFDKIKERDSRLIARLTEKRAVPYNADASDYPRFKEDL